VCSSDLLLGLAVILATFYWPAASLQGVFYEGDILRYVFFHSIALATLVGILVYLQAYVAPFTGMVVR